MNDLKQDIVWLEQSPKNAIEVYDGVTENRLAKNLTKETILAEHESIEDYFLSLEKNGHTTIAIQKTQKYGNSFPRKGIMNKYRLGKVEGQSVANGGNTAMPAPAQQAQPPMPGMGMPGLGWGEVMNLNTKASKYDELKPELERTLEKVERLEAEKNKLWQENLEYKIGSESKPGTAEKLIEAITNNPEIITSVAQALAAKGQAPALNAPANDGISQVKAALINVIKRDEVADEMAIWAYQLITQLVNNNEGFVKDFHNILKKHNLVQQPQQQAKTDENGKLRSA